jgi:hypothetical protein
LESCPWPFEAHTLISEVLKRNEVCVRNEMANKLNICGPTSSRAPLAIPQPLPRCPETVVLFGHPN